MAYPIKDFRDAAQYPAHSGLNAWRWEFLRRNPEYQAFYEKHKDDERPPYCGEYGIRSLYDPLFDRAYEGFLPPSGLMELPTFETVRKWEKVPGYTAERALESILSTLTEFQFLGDTIAVINRALPIEPQLAAIRESVEMRNALDGQTPAILRDRRAEWPSYLRILDGLAEGATFDEVAAVLYPETDNSYPDFAGRKRVSKATERARFLCGTFAVKKFAPEK